MVRTSPRRNPAKRVCRNGKNVVISIRKPILALAKIGSCQVWLTKVYDLRKKYEQELAEMYLIVNGMDDDLRQMMTIEKD